MRTLRSCSHAHRDLVQFEEVARSTQDLGVRGRMVRKIRERHGDMEGALMKHPARLQRVKQGREVYDSVGPKGNNKIIGLFVCLCVLYVIFSIVLQNNIHVYVWYPSLHA